VLNIKFMKSLWNEPNTIIKIRSLFKSFFKRGGMQLQVNVCDTETLKLAIQNPEKYSSLIIRVGGYSAYFSTLSRTLQEEIIKRTEYSWFIEAQLNCGRENIFDRFYSNFWR
jgi:pyruvate-formate lyase